MALMPETNRIKRVGVVIEFEDGRRAMMFSDDPAAEVTVTSEREHDWTGYYGETVRANPMIRSVTVGNLSRYTMQFTDPEATKQSLDQIKGQITPR